jgi:phenylacetate-CoA ligase
MIRPQGSSGDSPLLIRGTGYSAHRGPAPAARPARAEQALYSALFHVTGALVGRRFSAARRELQCAQWLSTDELKARMQSRLAALLRHAAENVPFYRDLYGRLELASDALRTVADLGRLPIMSRATHQQESSERFFAGNLPPHRRLKQSTSGSSTGEPFQFCLDRQAMPVVFASHLYYDGCYGLRPFDRYVRIVLTHPTPPPLPSETPVTYRLRQAVTARLKALYEARTQERISVWEVDSEKAEAVYRRIEAFRPDYVLGYTSTLAAVADELTQRGLRLSRRVKGVVTIAETLSPLRRQLIEAYFAAPIINRYGLREFGSWSAQSCWETPEQFHLNTELVVWETVRDDGTPAAPGETGRVVLTDLHNYAMPFIRYDTGDLAVAGEAACPCGRGFPLVGPIQGRSAECIRTSAGKLISAVVLGAYLKIGGPQFRYRDHLDAVRHYQLVQEAPGRVRMLIVPAPGFDAERQRRLQEDLTRLLGEDVTVDVETVEEIPPERSGKRPVIKQLRGRGERPQGTHPPPNSQLSTGSEAS